MFATDFLFDNQCASDFGCMICSFDGSPEPVSGGEIEYNAVKSPGRDAFTFYGSQLGSVITWNFSICKNPCLNDDMHFTRHEESTIMKWLVKTDGYRWIRFNQEGYEDIFYRVYINAKPRQIAGRTVGFDLTATSDCAYGFTDVISKETSLTKSGALTLDIHSDIDTYILPITKINTNTDASSKINYFSINNFRDNSLNSVLHKPVTFHNIFGNICMDSSTDIIEGLQNPDDFSWNFLKLVDGRNKITVQTDFSSEVDIELQYREPRYVRV